MNLPELSQYDALLFDFDGTLINSMPAHIEAWVKTVKNYGYELDPDILYELAGIPTLKTAEILNERLKWKLPLSETAEQKELAYEQNLDKVKVSDKVFEIVKEQQGKRPIIVVTGGERELIQKVLKKLQLAEFFDAIVTADDTERGKPSPDPFLLGAEKALAKPNRCLVFEDGEAGIKGAMAAGMDVIKVDLRQNDIFIDKLLQNE